jgi:penicillin-binding protein 2
MMRIQPLFKKLIQKFPWKRVLSRAVFLTLIATLMLATVLLCVLQRYYQRAEAYDLSKLNEYNTTNLFYDCHGIEIGRLFLEDRFLLSHEEIPDLMRQAAISVEDKRFYFHTGIDVWSIMRAMVVNLKNREKKQGGSTISQQLAKHLIGNFDRTFDRKLVEAFLARRIERHYSKEQILDFYLNRIYFGKGYFGLASAARGYFGKEAKNMNLEECALLAGIIKAPNSHSPRSNLQKALQRRNSSLMKMQAMNFITSEEAGRAARSKIRIVEADLNQSIRGIKSYFMAQAYKELIQLLNLGEEFPQGLRVYTTLDSKMQKGAEVEVEKHLKEIQAKRFPGKQQSKDAEASLQAAALVLDLASGAIKVLIGGTNFKDSPFDRTTMSRRENGALLQPFLYSLAFDRLALHPASLINAHYLPKAEGASPDEVAFGDPEKDLSTRFLTAHDALALSHKACATRVGVQLGPNALIDWLVKTGIPKSAADAENFWSMRPLTLMEISSLYQALGNGGVQQKPYTIELVKNVNGEVVYQAPHAAGKEILNSFVARQMALTLQGVVREGTAQILSRKYRFSTPIGGMTGYSEGYRDAWFVGYTPNLVGGIWVGFDESKPIGSKSLASRAAVPIWGNMMKQIFQIDQQRGVFPVPEGLTKVEIDRYSGQIRGLGFLSPSAGDIFVYLKQSQINQVMEEGAQAATRVQQPQDWSDWLSTMFADPGEADLLPDMEGSIPASAEYALPGLRGSILAADGKSLATTQQSYNLVLSWPPLEVARGTDRAVAWVKKRITMAANWLKISIQIPDAELRSLYQYERFQPITVVENLTPQQVEEFSKSAISQDKMFSLQGVPRRVYPYNKMFSHGLGYLKRTQKRNLGEHQADEVIYDRYAGSFGLEEVFDQELTGKDGHLTIFTTPDGFTKQAVIGHEAELGLNVKTTIRVNVQEAVENSIENIRAGAVVVLDVSNGDVVAMLSRPAFDPNRFIPGLLPQQWQAIIHAKKSPLLNRAYRQRHPPGSTFKVITSIAAMRAGVFDASRVVECPGYFFVGKHQYRFPRETQPVSYRAAIAHSYNTYFLDLGLRVGGDQLLSTAREMGLGRSTGFILPGEADGLIPDAEFVRVTHGRVMGIGDVANTSIGQGDVLVTPLQMANWMAMVANNGTLFKPRLVSQVEDPQGKAIRTFPVEVLNKASFPSESFRSLKEGLVAVTEEGTATAAQVQGIRIAAKTGTAQVGSKRKPRQIAWLTGYVPADRPEYAFCVMVEGDEDQDLHGGTDAGEIAGRFLTSLYGKSSIAAKDP